MADFTKRAIKESFLKLLNAKPLAKITVKDIVEDCGINRNSFYYHYQDVPTLLQEIITEQSQKLLDEFPEITSIEEAFEATIKFMLDNKVAVNHIYNSVSRDAFEDYLFIISEKSMSRYVEVAMSDLSLTQEDKKLLIRFGKCECVGIILEWLHGGMKEDIIENGRRIFALYHMLNANGGIEGFIKK